MYYLLNETKQIVAADDRLLLACKAHDINQLFAKIILNEVKFTPLENNKIMIDCEGETSTYLSKQTPLASMLGKLTIVSLTHDDENLDDIKFKNS